MIWPVQTVPKITHNVSSATLSLYSLSRYTEWLSLCNCTGICDVLFESILVCGRFVWLAWSMSVQLQCAYSELKRRLSRYHTSRIQCCDTTMLILSLLLKYDNLVNRRHIMKWVSCISQTLKLLSNSISCSIHKLIMLYPKLDLAGSRLNALRNLALLYPSYISTFLDKQWILFKANKYYVTCHDP